MTLKELIKELQKHSMAMDKPVRMSRDTEGNGFSSIEKGCFDETMKFFYIYPYKEHMEYEE